MPQPRRSVWFRDEKPRRPRLSRERIVAAAISLLDAEGVDGFSMRRLAARLDAGTMSLYAYVASKEDVLDLALDAAMGEVELDEDPPPGTPERPPEDLPADGSWRAVLTRNLTQVRQVMRRHPWVTTLVGTRPLLGPNALARSERFYAALVRAGGTLDTKGGPLLVAAVSALFSYVHGFTAAENAWRTWVTDPAGETELRRQAQQHLVEHAERYPTLSRHAQLEDADFDAGFARGLGIILDGIQTQLPDQGQNPGQGPPAPPVDPPRAR